MNIILVEDDPILSETIRLGWPDAADKIEVFGSYAEFQPVLFSSRLAAASCIVLDLQLPDGSGSQIATDIRKSSDIPIIILSGWGDTEYRANLINQGIDDYVLKPLSVKELHARVARLVKRRAPVAAPADSQINAVTFDRTRRALVLGDSQVDLTHAEFQLLSALIDAGGRVVPREELYLRAFGRPYKDGEKVLETYVSRLRHKLEKLEATTSDAIQTARGAGYRIIAQASGD